MLLKKIFLYIFIFIFGFSIAFYSVKIYNRSRLEYNNQSLYITEQPLTENNTDSPIPENSTDNSTFSTLEQESIDIMVDTTLPPLTQYMKNPKKLKQACNKMYPQYNNMSRAQWAKNYTLSHIYNEKSIDFYVQEDIWTELTPLQQEMIMQDLLYCNKIAVQTKDIKNINIISASDNMVLSSYTKHKDLKHDV